MASAAETFNVLFLCTGNSARSILAEAIMNRACAAKFRAFSAGSTPKGEINPHALHLLQKLNHPTANLRSKPWDEFAGPDAPQLDFVFTVCDDAAGEVCPVWPGQPMTAHWGISDPAAVDGSEAVIALAVAEAYRQLNGRITAFINLPIASLGRLTLQRRLDEIGKAGQQQPAAAARAGAAFRRRQAGRRDNSVRCISLAIWRKPAVLSV